MWADGTAIYAIKVWWGTTSALYGDNSNGTRTVATLAANQWVSDIWVRLLPGISVCCDSPIRRRSQSNFRTSTASSKET